MSIVNILLQLMNQFPIIFVIILLKILGITGLIMLVPVWAMLKVASDADDMEEEYLRRALEFKEKKED